MQKKTKQKHPQQNNNNQKIPPTKLKTFEFGDSEPDSKSQIASWLLHIFQTICHASVLFTSKHHSQTGVCIKEDDQTRHNTRNAWRHCGYLGWKKEYLRE